VPRLNNLKIKTLLKISLISLLAAGSFSALRQARQQYVPTRILVKFRDGVSGEKGRVVLQQLGAHSISTIPKLGVHVVEVSGSPGEKAIAAFKRQAEVESAELDRVVRPSTITPNDPYFYNQPLSEISVPSAWDTTTGSSGVVIAFVDTGVDSTHEDLASKIVPGWNVYNNNSDTSDVGSGHGTWSAGTAAEISNNGLGTAGVCWGCRIMPVRVSDQYGLASMSNIASGIIWAADHGARIVNIGFSVDNDPTVMAAAQYLQSRGGVAIAASGNDGLFSSNPDNPYVITVSAIGPFGAPSYANTGNNLDLVAPACNWVATPPGKYYSYSACGTSISSAFVAGVAGLIVSWKPSLSPADITRTLQQSADDKGPGGWDSTYGWGEVNAARALSQNLGSVSDTTPPTVNISSPSNGWTVSGTITISTPASDNTGITSFRISVGGSTLCSGASAPYPCSWNTANVGNGGPYTLTVAVWDAAGNGAVASSSVYVNNSVGDRTPPTVSIVSTANGSTVSGTITLTVYANDDTAVSAVGIYVGETTVCTFTAPPYSCTWNTASVGNGAYTLKAAAWDTTGNGAVAPITVYVNNGFGDTTPPSLSITSPTAWSTVSGMVYLTVAASDDNAVSTAMISVNGAVVCSFASPPFSCFWNTTSFPSGGPYTVEAVVWDAAGNGAVSSVNVFLNN
jgi:subtilase family protein/Big-like domain-containing protein/fervidolysin-like protein